MNKVVILTDSTADLGKELLDSYQIESIPLFVLFGEESFRDGIDITTKELYERVEKTGILPKTSAVSPGSFFAFLEPKIKAGYDVLYMGIGSKFSATFQSALLAQSELPENRFFIVDSKNLSSGTGLLLLKAKDLRDKGLSAKEIKTEIEKLVPRVRSQFAIQTLDYLHKGGRASGTAKLFGTLLRIKPIIQVRNGEMSVYKKPIGKMSRALDIMLDDFFAEKDKLDLEYVMITHSEANRHAKYMKEKINSKVKVKHLLETYAGCVISSHCGSGTIGVLYLVKE